MATLSSKILPSRQMPQGCDATPGPSPAEPAKNVGNLRVEEHLFLLVSATTPTKAKVVKEEPISPSKKKRKLLLSTRFVFDKIITENKAKEPAVEPPPACPMKTAQPTDPVIVESPSHPPSERQSLIIPLFRTPKLHQALVEEQNFPYDDPRGPDLIPSNL